MATRPSGRHVCPLPVESACLEHPAAAEVRAIGKLDAVAGEMLKAFVARCLPHEGAMSTEHARHTRTATVGAAVAAALLLLPWPGAPGRAAGQWRVPATISYSRTTQGSASADRSGPAAVALPSPVGRLVTPPAAAGDGRRRSPLVAGFLGILPGLGHVYAGEVGRGLAVGGVWLGSGMVMFGSSNEVVTGVAAVVNIGAYVFSIADAALAAERFNRRHARPDGRVAADSTRAPR